MADESIELDLKGKKLKFTGNDIFTMIGALSTVAILVGGYFHHKGQEDGRAEFVSAMKAAASATYESVAVTRERNCLDRFAPEERIKASEWCKDVSGSRRFETRGR